MLAWVKTKIHLLHSWYSSMYFLKPRVFYFCKRRFIETSCKNMAMCKRVVVNGFDYTPEYEKLYKEYYSSGLCIEIPNLLKKDEKEYVIKQLYWRLGLPVIELVLEDDKEMK